MRSPVSRDDQPADAGSHSQKLLMGVPPFEPKALPGPVQLDG